MNIRVDLNTPIKDGMDVKFRSPVDCSQVTGLVLYYDGSSQEFMFADAHGNNVGDIDHLFTADVVVKVILDLDTGMAFVQNADTNAYLEGRFEDTSDAIICDVSGVGVTMTDASNRAFRGLTLYGKTTDGVNAGYGGSIGVSVLGKNLLPYPYTDKTVTRNGVTFTVADDGSLTLNTDAEGSANITKFAIAARNTSQALPKLLPLSIIPKGVYTASMNAPLPSGVMIQFYFYDSGDNALTSFSLDSANSKTFTVPSKTVGWYICVRVAKGVVVQNLQITLMVEQGSVATAYEPYTAQTLSVPTPNGLGDGEEIDFTKGVLIHNDGSETPLDADTLEAYAKLHTNKPNTGVFNDAGVEMSVSYVADTKLYIDNKFTELQNAILASGANV